MFPKGTAWALLFASIGYSQTPAAQASGQEERARAAMASSLQRQRDSVARQLSNQRAAPAPLQPIVVMPMAAATTASPWKAPPCPPVSEDWLNPEIERTASEQDVPIALLRAVASTESAYFPCAVSPKGAMGLMQIMPATAKGLGLSNPFDARDNLKAGARYLKQLLDRYGGDLESALGAYNAGPGAVDRFQGIPPYAETQEYVRKVLSQLAPREQ